MRSSSRLSQLRLAGRCCHRHLRWSMLEAQVSRWFAVVYIVQSRSKWCSMGWIFMGVYLGIVLQLLYTKIFTEKTLYLWIVWKFIGDMGYHWIINDDNGTCNWIAWDEKSRNMILGCVWQWEIPPNEYFHGKLDDTPWNLGVCYFQLIVYANSPHNSGLVSRWWWVDMGWQWLTLQQGLVVGVTFLGHP